MKLYVCIGFTVGLFSNEIKYLFKKYSSKYNNTYLFIKIEGFIIKYNLFNIFSLIKWVIIIKILILLFNLLLILIEGNVHIFSQGIGDIFKHMSGSISGSISGSGNDNTINVENPSVNMDKLSLTFNTPSVSFNVSNLTGLGIGAGAVKAGISIANKVHGTGAKAAACLAVLGASVAITGMVRKIVDSSGKPLSKSDENKNYYQILNKLGLLEM